MNQGTVIKIELKTSTGGTMLVYDSAWAGQETATGSLSASPSQIIVEEGRLSREEAKQQYWPFVKD